MKGVGNYSTTNAPRVERKPFTVVSYRGPRADIRAHDGVVCCIPSAPLQKIGIPPGGSFMMLTTWVGARVVDVRVQPIAAAREDLGFRKLTPKVYLRTGQKLATRRP